MSICSTEIPAGIGPAICCTQAPRKRPAYRKPTKTTTRRMDFSKFQGRRSKTSVVPKKMRALPASHEKLAFPFTAARVWCRALTSREPTKKQMKTLKSKRTIASDFHGLTDNTGRKLYQAIASDDGKRFWLGRI